MNHLHCIVYTSKSTIEWTSQQLTSLLNTAQNKNRVLGVTGILMQIDGRFIQVIEGESLSKLDALMDTISTDSRHEDVLLLMRSPIPERKFSRWTMGFHNCTDAREFEELSGYSDVDAFIRDISIEKGWSPAFEFLKMFYQKNVDSSVQRQA